MLPRKTSTAP